MTMENHDCMQGMNHGCMQRMNHGCMQGMKKASFYQFILPKAQEQYLKIVVEEEEDVKPIILAGGKIQEAACSNSRGMMIPRFEVEIRRNPELLHLFPWEIKKILTKGDVGGNGNEGLRLRAEQVQNHILKHWKKREEKEYEEWNFNNAGGAIMSEPVVIHDLDTNTLHSLVLYQWDAFHIYNIHNSWLEEFVMRRRLSQGTLIGMYWDIKRFCLCFSVLESPFN